MPADLWPFLLHAILHTSIQQKYRHTLLLFLSITWSHWVMRLSHLDSRCLTNSGHGPSLSTTHTISNTTLTVQQHTVTITVQSVGKILSTEAEIRHLYPASYLTLTNARPHTRAKRECHKKQTHRKQETTLWQARNYYGNMTGCWGGENESKRCGR